WLATSLCYALEQVGILPTMVQFAMFEAANLMFLVLTVYNRHRYKRDSVGNLSDKYTVSVNLRTIRALNYLSVLTAVRNFITMGLLFTILHRGFGGWYNDYNEKLLAHCYDLTVAFYSLLFPFAVVFMHQELRRNFLICVVRCKSVDADANATAVNAIGETIVHRYSGSDDYFRHLQTQWRR
ncbi:hypothetical protein AAVH_31823, partial [Aphelenchoides avenae]